MANDQAESLWSGRIKGISAMYGGGMSRGNITIALITIAATLPLLFACQSTMSIEEAKKVTASFTDSSFVPPPRTITDITAVLDEQKRDNPEVPIKALAQAGERPPESADARTLAEFYRQRGKAAYAAGRVAQAIDDLTRAAEYVARVRDGSDLELWILYDLARLEFSGGSQSRGLNYLQQAISRVGSHQRAWLIPLNGVLAREAAGRDLELAERAMREAVSVRNEAYRWNVIPEYVARYDFHVASAQAAVLQQKGRFAEAERLWRQSIAALANEPTTSKDGWIEVNTGQLAWALMRQGRLIEAEVEARKALLGRLRKYGRYSSATALQVRRLARVIAEQGRHAEAEMLARAAIEIYDKTGSSAASSPLVSGARQELARALAAQEHWGQANQEYARIREEMKDDKLFIRWVATDAYFHLTMLMTGQTREAAEVLASAIDMLTSRLGGDHYIVAGFRGLLGMAYTAQGDRRAALREFAAATPFLFSRSVEPDDERITRATRDQLIRRVVSAYIRLLSELQTTDLEPPAIDSAAETFRLAQVAHGRSVQRALDASAARSVVGKPELAELVRREQDAVKQIGALSALLTNLLGRPTQEQDPKSITSLATQIDKLRRARETLRRQTEREYPAYSQLTNPAPATVSQVQASLRHRETLLATYVTEDRTFVWAIPFKGRVAFASSRLGAKDLDQTVTSIRKALDPSAKTLGEIPEIDLRLAYELYRELLEPVKASWETAETVLFVGDGPLGQLPLALLPTKPTMLPPKSGAFFSEYRVVPWLVRSHAIVMLPSVSSLVTLRTLPDGDPTRRPFVGFGDPYFNEEQARAARLRGRREMTAMISRAEPITLRDLTIVPRNSVRLTMLPRLPETADEIRDIAEALNADVAKDVFLGENANERTVKNMDLARYRVIAFATHGLAPGSLDGLTQPALALSAPEVAQVDGDGLLTMEEILGLRLNADWVVLSACNTGSGKGQGAEAVSGLGRAFFYAGARALLVSNWPVETTSTRSLTTDLFRRQQANASLTRAKALQQTMNALIDDGYFTDPATKRVVFSYAHPIFWAAFTLVGDGSGR